MKRMKPMRVVVGLVSAVVMLGLQTGLAEAQICCRIASNGLLITSESHELCNSSGLQTRSLGAGIREVDFDIADVRSLPRLATLDTQATGNFSGSIGVADRAGDVSSVFVEILTSAGVRTNRGFNLCLF